MKDRKCVPDRRFQDSSILTPGRLAHLFSNPPVAFRPAPFTILNDEYEDGRGEQQLTALLESLARAGFGGAYLHARPGLITEYLSPRWFELIRHCLTECKRIGLIPHLYDENSYPSGFSGGHVPARVPETRSRYVHFVKGQGPEALPGACLALFHWNGETPGPALDRETVTDTTPWIAFLLQDFPPSAWHGETIYPSLLDPRTTEAFLETTYEAYHRELADLWPLAPSMFTDEPHLPGMEHGPWSPGLHLTPYVLGEFYRQKGYDLTPHLPELFFDTGNSRKVRYDFYDLCHRLWMENWALPLERWCRQHDIRLTGHYLEHDWPCPYATPGHVHLLAHMDWPGTDMLSGFLLKGHDFFDIQGFEAVPPGIEPHGLLVLRQASSVAHQLAKERVINECWGAGGGESAPEDWMRIGRWLIVHGVNLLVPHSSWDTIRGARKADHPPNFAPQSPWFESLKPLNDELARLCWLSTQGECFNRVLVIDSLTSGFCVSRKAESSDPSAIDALKNVLTSSAEGALPSTLPLKRAADWFAQDLSDAQIDFDLGDEYVLEEFGGVRDGHLTIGVRAYPVVALMPGTNHLRTATLQRLHESLSQGGRLLAVQTEEFWVDGDQTEPWIHLRQEFGEQIEIFADAGALQQRLIELAPPRLAFRGQVPARGVAHMHRRTEEGEIILVVNSSPEPLSGSVLLQTAHPAIAGLEPASGHAFQTSPVAMAGGWEVPLQIPAGGAFAFYATVQSLAGLPPAPVLDQKLSLEESAAPQLIEAKRLEDNILVLDFCALELRGETFPAENVAAANLRYWKAHGFESNGWNNLIQYRDQILARDQQMSADSGGAVHYEFTLASGVALHDLKLAVECPELWTVEVNGTPVVIPQQNTFRDPRLHWADVSPLLRHGLNHITLRGQPFTVRQEIAPVYLLGDFACEPQERGFRIGPAQAITWGSWKAQGMPFYDGAVAYSLRLPAHTRRLTFPRTQWGGAVVSAFHQGREIGRTYEAPWSIDLPGGTLTEVEIRIIGLPINLFGPWHHHPHRWGLAVPHMWMGELPSTQPPGRDYGQVDLGLMEAPLALLSRTFPDPAESVLSPRLQDAESVVAV